MTKTKDSKKLQKIIEGIKQLEKTLHKVPTTFSINEEKLKNLSSSLKKAKDWHLTLLNIENEEEEIFTLPYTSKLSKELMESFLTFEAKHPYENLPGGLKISKLTHHSFCNVPVIAGAYKNTEERTDKILFYPASTLTTEKEYTFLKINEKKNKYSIEILKVYENSSLKKLLLYKIEKIEINKELVEIPEKIKEVDLQTIRTQAMAISKEESKNKIPLKNRSSIYKELHPVDSYEILSESKIITNEGKIQAEIVNEDGEVITYENLYSSRPVAFTIFGIGYEKEIGWFPAAMVINVFKRKDILSKKLSADEYLEKHTYHLNGKKLQVNYKNLYLKGIYGIDKIPSLWSYASLTANNGKLNITIPIPIQRKFENKWQRVKPSSLQRAVYQILKTEKINYKGKELFLPGKGMFIEKELIDIKEPSWLEEGINLIKNSVYAYKILQTIKRGIDSLQTDVPELEELSDILPVKKLKL